MAASSTGALEVNQPQADAVKDWLQQLAADGARIPDVVGGAQVIYPRAAVTLSVKLFPGPGQGVNEGDQIDVNVYPESVSLTRKPHTHADTCEIVLRGSGLQFDPRPIGDFVVNVFLGAADAIDGSIVQQENWRFLGCIEEDADAFGEGPGEIRLSFADLSYPLRHAGTISSKALPTYADDLKTALRRILDSVPKAGERLRIRSTLALTGTSLAQLTDKRGRTAPIPMPKKNTTPWEAIEYICGLCGLQAKVDRNELVVRRPGEAYPDPYIDDSDQPKALFLFYGEDANTLRVERKKRFVTLRKGVRCFAFDATNRKRIVADYPADNKLRPQVLAKSQYVRGAAQLELKAQQGTSATGQKATGAGSPSPATAHGKIIEAPKRDVYWIRGPQTLGKVSPDGTTATGLYAIAKSLYDQRSSQEITGSLTTVQWDATILSLWNGDRIQLVIDPALEADLQGLRSSRARIDFLSDRLGLSEDAARLVSLVYARKRGDLFYVHAAHFDWHASARPEVKIDFLNIIDVKPETSTATH